MMNEKILYNPGIGVAFGSLTQEHEKGAPTDN